MAGLEIWGGPHGRQVVDLVDERYVVGKADDVDIVITGDSTVSAAHMRLERIGTRWYVRDLNARNGTKVNGTRIVGEQTLRNGDELTLGRTRLVFHSHTAGKDGTTDALEPAPELTKMQRTVLIELCRPLLSGNAFTQPASVREVAGVIFTTTANVRQHLDHLYRKFDIPPGVQNRLLVLANEAVQRGAVTTKDLLPTDDDT